MEITKLIPKRFIKFGIVGGIGALVQLSTLELLRILIPPFEIGLISVYIVSTILSIEIAIVSNFLLNNAWTFSDKKVEKAEVVKKFLTFNLSSLGSVVIQVIIAFIGENTIGLIDLFTVPVVGYVLDTGTVYAVVGILIGMLWNFFAYSKFVWNKKTS